MNIRHTIEASIGIRATPEALWHALTDAGELTRWFSTEARVMPGVGGSIWTAWHGEFESTARIEAWEPHRRLALSGAAGVSAPARVIVEFTIEARAGGVTMLRLVRGGFEWGGDGDREDDATRGGWEPDLPGLRHYLERHAGSPRRVVRIRHATDKTPEQAWTRLMGGTPGSHGLLAIRPLPTEGLRQGSPYRFITADGEVISGEVCMFAPPRDFAGTVRELNDAYLRVRINRSGPRTGGAGGIEIDLRLSLYGATELEAEVVEHRWGLLLGRA